MRKDIEDVVQQSAVNYRKMLIDNGGTSTSSADIDFTAGATWALTAGPALLKEQMEALLLWMKDIGPATWQRWTAFNYQPSDIFKEYLEHLKKQG